MNALSIASATLAATIPLASAGEAAATFHPAPAPSAGVHMEGMSMDIMSGDRRFEISGWGEAGITANFSAPDDRQNFGRLLDDRSKEPLLNQLVLSAQRYLDPRETGQFDWGFNVELFYGSDARYLHATGLLDLTTDDTIQPDLPEAWFLAHFPIAGTSGGLDLKLGKFANCFGADMIDPRQNVFYSRTYIFNYGCPFYGTGALATLHLQPGLEFYASIDRGLNVAVEDNNDSPSFYGGIGGSLAEGKLSYAALTHLGPENPRDNHNLRYLNDLTFTWKVTNKFTSITDLNYVDEESFDAQGYGLAQYFTYPGNDCLTLGIRGEVWRDEDGFFVAQFASNNDFLHFARGDDTVFDTRTVGGGNSTYGALTVGVTIRPPITKPFTGFLIRPELRYDRSLNGTRPFNDSSDRDMVTAAGDLVLSF